jgi:hypothetical protein
MIDEVRLSVFPHRQFNKSGVGAQRKLCKRAAGIQRLSDQLGWYQEAGTIRISGRIRTRNIKEQVRRRLTRTARPRALAAVPARSSSDPDKGR